MRLGSRRKIRYSQEKILARMFRSVPMRADINAFAPSRKDFILTTFLMNNADLRGFVESQNKPVRLNTDDRLRLEYSAPRHLYQYDVQKIHDWLDRYPKRYWFPEFTDRNDEDWYTDPGKTDLFLRHAVQASQSGKVSMAAHWVKAAERLKPNDEGTRLVAAKIYERSGNFGPAIRNYWRLSKNPENRERALDGVRRTKLKKRMTDEPLFQRSSVAYQLLGSLSFAMGDYEEALQAARTAFSLDPLIPKNAADLAVYSFMVGHQREALSMLQYARKIGPGDPNVLIAYKFFDEIAKSATPRQDAGAQAA